MHPRPLLRAFARQSQVIEIGWFGFRIIDVSFPPMVTSLLFPFFFHATGLTLMRTLVLFVPLGYLFSRWGLHAFWLTFPVTETLTSLPGGGFYRAFRKHLTFRNGCKFSAPPGRKLWKRALQRLESVL